MLVEMSSSNTKKLLYPDRNLGKCKLGRMKCVNLKETYFYQKLHEYISEGLVSIRESFYSIAFVSMNILMPKFYVLFLHFSNYLQQTILEIGVISELLSLVRVTIVSCTKVL